MDGQRNSPRRLTPGKKTRYPLNRRLGGPQGRSVGVWKISPPTGFNSLTAKSVLSGYNFKINLCVYN